VSTRPIDLIASAARTTLASGSARVQRIRFSDPPRPPEDDFGQTEPGVTDFERRRTQVELTFGRGLALLVEQLAARWPWLEDDESSSGDDPLRMIYAGTASFYGAAGRWTPISRDDASASRRGHTDPVWIVEALQFVDQAEGLERREAVRGDGCQMFRFGLRLERHRWQLEIPPHFGSTARLRGEVALDDSSRIRRVTWTRIDTYRPRARYRRPSDTQSWQRTELWDFGVEAKIEIPPVEPPDRTPLLVGLAQMVWWFWRRKRAYERRS
jgi:hypothetical protein